MGERSCEICRKPIPAARLAEATPARTCSKRCKTRRCRRRKRASQVRRGVRPANRERVAPARGELFARAVDEAKTRELGPRRSKLLALLAAYADAGEPSPAARTLARGLRCSIRKLDHLLDALEREGVIEVERGDKAKFKRNRYRLVGLGENAEATAAALTETSGVGCPD